jgi:hypothetical protein
MRPIGFECRSGCSIISTVTTSPVRTPLRLSGVTRISWLMRRFSGTTSVIPCSTNTRPTTLLFARSRTSTITPFAAPPAIDAHNTHQGTVAMQHLGHLPGFEIQVLAGIVGNEKAVAIRVSLDTAGNQAGAFGQNERALAVTQQLRFTLHRPQAALQELQLVLANVEQDAQRVEAHRLALLLEDLQDVLARRQGLFVGLQLALKIGIGASNRRQFAY